jgi:hypothetical protein
MIRVVLLWLWACGAPVAKEANVEVSTDLVRLRRTAKLPPVFTEGRWRGWVVGAASAVPGPTDGGVVVWLPVPDEGWAEVEAVTGPPGAEREVGVREHAAGVVPDGLPLRGPAYDCGPFDGSIWRCDAALRLPGGVLLVLRSG